MTESDLERLQQALLDQLQEDLTHLIAHFLEAPGAALSMVTFVLAQHITVGIIGDSEDEQSARARLAATIKLLQDNVDRTFTTTEEPS
jgi:signal transduction histidine kinase